MKNPIFYSDAYKKIEVETKDLLNVQPDFLNRSTIASTRATGDAIEQILEENFEQVVGEFSKEYSASFSRRAMADLAFTDLDDFYYVVDVKTHRRNAKFSMPNLTSVERLSRFYEDDRNCFVILMISYRVVSEIQIRVEKVHFVPIEFLSWNCLTIGALGWGQIQIANASKIEINQRYSRKQWMLEFCEILFEFYPREIEKINNRIDCFREVRKRWEEKEDIWT